jgi:hypothetical protein
VAEVSGTLARALAVAAIAAVTLWMLRPRLRALLGRTRRARF